ncbi:MAG: hypothetical protein JWO03_274 [Bacteroidetes bacterium]|nr:hypothetical protein [Bacteroidota bacterium]
MKKFEIISDKWIRQLVFDESYAGTRLFSAIKIDSITNIHGYFNEIGFQGLFRIKLMSDMGSGFSDGIHFVYKSSEKAEYESDLKFFEQLLFNRP